LQAAPADCFHLGCRSICSDRRGEPAGNDCHDRIDPALPVITDEQIVCPAEKVLERQRFRQFFRAYGYLKSETMLLLVDPNPGCGVMLNAEMLRRVKFLGLQDHFDKCQLKDKFFSRWQDTTVCHVA
jgi:hypothetical protein